VATPSTSHEIRFSEYTIDLRTGELRRNGDPLKLQPQPAKVLSILVSRAGEIVTRQELAEQVWGSETYVDFEHGLNYAVRHIRSVLEDDPENPHFLETIPKRGYRFIGTIQNLAVTEQVQPPVVPAEKTPPSEPAGGKLRYAVAGALVLAAIIGLAWYVRSSRVRRAAAEQVRSLAVLPLRNLSGDPNQEYFTDGITDELITDLAKADGLRVISHTSVEQYKGTKLPLPEIARELGGVDAIVEGTVMRSGDRVRITAQLIDSRSDQHLWADSYDRTLSDVLRTESEVSQSIAQTIQLKLSPEVRTHLEAAAPVSPEAHDAYLKGRFFWNQRSEPDLKKALDSFQQAIAKDPNYAPAYAGLADTYFYLGYYWGRMPPTDAMPLARAAAQKAIDIDPDSAEGHTSLGTVELTYDWNFPAAEQEFQRAIALNPNNEWSHHIYSALLIATGRPEQSIAEARKAVEVDPVSSSARNFLGLMLADAGRVDEAIQEDLKTLEIHPIQANLVGTHGRLQDSYRSKGMYEEAFEEHIKTLEAAGVDAKEVDRHRRVYAEKGWRGLDEDFLKQLLADWQKDHWHFTTFEIAGMYARLGDKDQAFTWLNKSVELRSTILWALDAEPAFASLRSDPRFAEIKRKMGASN
jgi:TolB-like protein/DNA-binding winged helix-turn-helix (wHTH) protein/Tfp pilus assembly protein PilF